MRSVLITLSLALALSTAGCSTIDELIGTDAPAVDTGEAKVDSSITEEPEGERAQGIEITWEVPAEPVDGFVVRYGTSADKLDRELRVAVSELKKEQDNVYGPVYRYTVSDINADAEIYVSLAAYKGDRLSDFSDTIRESGR